MCDAEAPCLHAVRSSAMTSLTVSICLQEASQASPKTASSRRVETPGLGSRRGLPCRKMRFLSSFLCTISNGFQEGVYRQRAGEGRRPLRGAAAGRPRAGLPGGASWGHPSPGRPLTSWVTEQDTDFHCTCLRQRFRGRGRRERAGRGPAREKMQRARAQGPYRGFIAGCAEGRVVLEGPA